MTEVEQPPQNGIDLSAAEDEDHNRTRPADIEQDMREMERRKRVESIMSSKIFREELERIVDTARETGNTAGILQQISDIVGLPSSRIGSVFKSSSCLLPINDIRGVESMGYAKGEKILRCKLAATFRLLDLYGWTHGLGAQITARLKVDQENFLVNPYGLMFHEITASSLNKVDMQGNVVEQGTTNFGVNKTHFALHSAVHAARPDIRCAIYIGCSPVVAVSSLKLGLLPISRESCVLGEISNHPYVGSLLDSEERDQIIRHLGPNSKVMLLSNHGALCCGDTIEESFHYACHLVAACETQLKLLPAGLENLNLIPEETRKIIYEQSRRPPEDLEKKFAALSTNEQHPEEEVKETSHKVIGTVPKWRIGGAEFEAMMRMLDNAGYRTGYIYRHPLVKSEPPRPKNDVELPPAVSSLGYLLEEEELFNKGIWKKGDLRKGGDRSRWLNSPNVYQKVEVLETGTPDPKKITKWVAEGSPTHSTPVRIDDALQFVPTNTNPREFKRLQQQIKDNRRADKISAGPQSHILEGVTWDEANRICDATVSSAGDHVVLMGAASKGIIQRGYQHNATVYKAPYAKNPFDNVTDDELNEYKLTVERKKKSIHGEYTDTDFSESEALNSIAAQKRKTAQSEPEDIAEHQVMRIETKQAPVPSQAEVVLSDATLSFINGERSHTATNRGRPPTGRESDVKKSEEKSEEDDSQNQNPTKNNRRRRLFAKKLFKYPDIPEAYRKYGKPLLKELKSAFIKKNLNMNVVNAEGSEVKEECKVDQLENYNYDYYADCSDMCNTSNEEEINNDTFELDPNNASVFVNMSDIAYYDSNNLFKVSDKCHTPTICVRILKRLYKTFGNNFYASSGANSAGVSTVTSPTKSTNSNYTLGSGTTAVSYYGSLQLKRQQPSNTGYRTVSHFGFVTPLGLPQPEHKHMPLYNGGVTQYKPLRRSISYEAMFTTKRYADLCEHCFERIIRLKPEFLEKPARLRNLASMSPKSKVSNETRYEEADYVAVEQEKIYDKEEECYDYVIVENDLDRRQQMPPPYLHLNVLPTVSEEYEDLSTQNVRSDVEVHAGIPVVEQTPSNHSFFKKITRFNFSEESTNDNFDPAREVSSNISVSHIEDDDADNNASEHQMQQIDPPRVVEIWQFDDFHEFEEHETECGNKNRLNETTDENCESSLRGRITVLKKLHEQGSLLMTRNERNERKTIFQELWEDHVHYFGERDKSDSDSDVSLVVHEDENSISERLNLSINELHRDTKQQQQCDAFPQCVEDFCKLEAVTEPINEEDEENSDVKATNEGTIIIEADKKEDNSGHKKESKNEFVSSRRPSHDSTDNHDECGNGLNINEARNETEMEIPSHSLNYNDNQHQDCIKNLESNIDMLQVDMNITYELSCDPIDNGLDKNKVIDEEDIDSSSQIYCESGNKHQDFYKNQLSNLGMHQADMNVTNKSSWNPVENGLDKNKVIDEEDIDSSSQSWCESEGYQETFYKNQESNLGMHQADMNVTNEISCDPIDNGLDKNKVIDEKDIEGSSQILPNTDEQPDRLTDFLFCSSINNDQTYQIIENDIESYSCSNQRLWEESQSPTNSKTDYDDYEQEDDVDTEFNLFSKPIFQSTPESKRNDDEKQNTNDEDSNDIPFYEDDSEGPYSDGVLTTVKRHNISLHHHVMQSGNRFFREFKSADDIWRSATNRADAKVLEHVSDLNAEIEEAYGLSSSENDSENQWGEYESFNDDNKDSNEFKTANHLLERIAAMRRNSSDTPPQCKLIDLVEDVEYKSPPLKAIVEESEAGEEESVRVPKCLKFQEEVNDECFYSQHESKSSTELLSEYELHEEPEVDDDLSSEYESTNDALEPLTENSEEELTVNSEEELTVNSEEELTVNSEEELTVNSEEELTVNSEEELTVNSEEELTVSSEEELTVSSTEKSIKKLPENSNEEKENETNSIDDDNSLDSNNNDFTPCERKILRKIEINNLKNELIFEKIDQSIRNKLTPRKLENLLKSSTEDGLNFSSSSLSLLFGGSIAPNNSINSERGSNDSLKGNNKTDLTVILQRRSRSLDNSHSSSSASSDTLSVSSYNIDLKTRRSRSTGQKIGKRNFILENIRNASSPRLYIPKKRAGVKAESESKQVKTAIKSGTNDIQICSSNIPPVYSFQSKLVAGSSKIWLSLDKDKVTPRQIKNLQKIIKQQSQQSVSCITSKRCGDSNIFRHRVRTEKRTATCTKQNNKMNSQAAVNKKLGENGKCTRDIDECCMLETGGDQSELCEMAAQTLFGEDEI